TSDIARQLLGHFRLSVTSFRDPGRVVSIPFALRPLLGKPNATVNAQTNGDQDDAAPLAGRNPRQQLKRQWQSVAPELAALRDRIADLQQQIQALKIPATLILSENSQVSHPSTNLRIRGDFTNKGEEVLANLPAFLGSLPANVPQNRLGLARWLV